MRVSAGEIAALRSNVERTRGYLARSDMARAAVARELDRLEQHIARLSGDPAMLITARRAAPARATPARSPRALAIAAVVAAGAAAATALVWKVTSTRDARSLSTATDARPSGPAEDSLAVVPSFVTPGASTQEESAAPTRTPAPALTNEAGSAAARPASAGNLAALTIICEPYCHEISDNGVELGEGPVYARPVPAGRHHLTVSGGGAKKELVVDVAAGQVKKVIVPITTAPELGAAAEERVTPPGVARNYGF